MESLGMIDPMVIHVNPNRKNIYFSSSRRGNHGETMRDYVTKSKCKREMILNYFGFPVPSASEAVHKCCDYHQKICDCDDCIISNVSNMFEENMQDEVNLPADISEAEQRQLEPDVEEKLREELDLFRLSLPGSGRSSVGSTSLSSGITITLMDQVVQNAFFLTTVEEIESRLPIYSRKYATAIWAIVQKYT